MTDITNEKIFQDGVAIPAIKRPMVTICLGKFSDLSHLPGVIWNSNGQVVISTLDFPEGHVFPQDSTAFVRLGGIGFKAKTNGFYDIEAFDTDSFDESLGHVFSLSDLPTNVFNELRPLLDVSSNHTMRIAGVHSGFYAIFITKQMVGSLGYIMCHSLGDPIGKLTKLHPEDIFVVENFETYEGYKMSKKEFNKYYYFE